MPYTAFRPAQHGFAFPNKFVNTVSISGINVTTKGRCGGMVYAALDYFNSGTRLPRTSSEVPSDDDALAKYIMARQWSSLVDMAGMFLTKLAQQAAPTVDLGPLGHIGPGLSAEDQFLSGLDYFEGVRQSIDRGTPIVVGLINIDFDPGANHQVLAIGYDAGADRFDRRIHLYDPNRPGVITTLRPDPQNNRFVMNNSDKVWRTLFNSTEYRPIAPPVFRLPANSAGAAVGRMSRHVDVFWVGPDRAVGSTAWDANADNARWLAPYPVAPHGAVRAGSVVVAVARKADHLDVFWVGPDGAIGSTAWDANADNARWLLPFPVTPPGAARAGSAVCAAARKPDHLDVFWIGPDGAIGSTAWDANADNARWITPFPITPPGAAGPGPSIAAVARKPDHLDVFWVGPDGAIGSTAWDANADNARWVAPFPITPPGAARPGSPVTAVARNADHLDVFWIGPDGAIGSTTWDARANNARWAAPFPITPPAASRADSPLAAVSRLPEHLDVFWIGPDGAIGSTAWDARTNNARWVPPFPITPPGASKAGSLLAAVDRMPQQLDVFWIGPDRALGSTAWAVDANDARWSPPFPITPPGAAG